MDIKSSPVLRIFLAFFFLHFATDTFAQAKDSTNLFVITLIVLCAILMIVIVIQVADNLLRVEARRKGLDEKTSVGLWPALKDMFRPKLPSYLEDEEVHILSRGYDILLEGQPKKLLTEAGNVTRYAIQPPNFQGISPIPKVIVEPGTSVQAGDPILFDKKRPDIMYVAPVSGEVIELNRGEKRAIIEVVILADKEVSYKQFNPPDFREGPREEIVSFMLESGAWTLLRQRPYDIVPDENIEPDNIFISTFDSAPLAPDLGFIVQDKGEDFQTGLDVLSSLTKGNVHLSLDARGNKPPNSIFTKAKGVEKHWFRGPHPIGNVGIQIHHIDPIRPEKKVWTVGVQEVIMLGRLFSKGIYDSSRIIAITGEPLEKPAYVKTYQGANVGELLNADNLKSGLRYISGDVLSGQQRTANQYLNILDDQITVIREGNYYEMFGWLLPLNERPSVSKTYPNFLFPDMRFIGDTNTHGERRAFVMTGEYEKVLPMEIYVQHLMKAVITNNFERMEGLGILELTEEDVALCEFACTSKMPLQKILREGLEMMREQGA